MPSISDPRVLTAGRYAIAGLKTSSIIQSLSGSAYSMKMLLPTSRRGCRVRGAIWDSALELFWEVMVIYLTPFRPHLSAIRACVVPNNQENIEYASPNACVGRLLGGRFAMPCIHEGVEHATCPVLCMKWWHETPKERQRPTNQITYESVLVVAVTPQVRNGTRSRNQSLFCRPPGRILLST